MKKRFTIVVGALAVLFTLSLLSGSPAETQTSKKYELRMGTAVTGGVVQILGSIILEDIKKANPNITGSTVPGTVTTNLMGIQLKKFNIGFSLADTTAAAWEGESYFEPTGPVRNIRSLAVLYPQVTQLVVRANSGIRKIEDFRGKRMSPAAKGTSNDLEARRLLKLYGMTYDDMRVQFLSMEDAALQFTDGHLDVLVFMAPLPFASVINVSSRVPIRLIPIPDDKVAQLTKFRGLEAYTVPANLYKGVDYPVRGIASWMHLVVAEDMPDEPAYTIVKTIAENFSRYSKLMQFMQYGRMEDMAKDVGIPLHPGAVKYYKERGWLK